jgi:hypothetical protein
MAGRITLWGAGQLISTYFGQAQPVPSAFYLALIKNIPPTPYVSGAELDEPIGLGYGRAEIPNNLSYFSNAGQIQVSILNRDITFAPATGDWGDLRYWALCNASVDGFVFAIGSLETQMRISNSDTVLVGAGDLGVTVGPFFTSTGDNLPAYQQPEEV